MTTIAFWSVALLFVLAAKVHSQPANVTNTHEFNVTIKTAEFQFTPLNASVTIELIVDNRSIPLLHTPFARLSPGRRSIYKAASSVGIRDVDDIRLSWIPQPGFLPSEVESEAIVNFYQVQLQSDKVYNVFTTFEFPASLKPRERYEFPNIRRFWKN